MTGYLAQQAFDLSAKTFGEKTAIFSQAESISYGDLYTATNRLAHCLKKKGVHRGDRVAILLPRSIHSIRAMLAILKADALYVPMDAKVPPQRAKELIEDCAPAAIICHPSTQDTVTSVLKQTSFQPGVFILDGQATDHRAEESPVLEEEILGCAGTEPIYRNIDQDPAYILYTSGSTDKPKGVMISHANLRQYIEWAASYFQIHSDDQILSTAPLHVDMSVFDIYCALFTGASITLAAERSLLFPALLIELIQERGITIWKGVASLLSHIVKMRALKPGKLNTLRKIIFSGEPLPGKYLVAWMKMYPGIQFFNAYGPTECTGISTCYKIGRIPANEGEPVPIGKACANKEIFAVREDGSLAEAGEAGELFIRGSSLSHGYWRDREKTERAFVRNLLNRDFEERAYRTGDWVKKLPDGNYIFLGRKDQQIKHMGYRIELGEIDWALQGVHAVNDAVTIAVKGPDGENPEIIAYAELDRGANLDQITADIRKALPKHMVPSKIQPIQQLPRTANGKVDRQALMNLYVHGNG